MLVVKRPVHFTKPCLFEERIPVQCLPTRSLPYITVVPTGTVQENRIAGLRRRTHMSTLYVCVWQTGEGESGVKRRSAPCLLRQACLRAPRPRTATGQEQRSAANML